MFNGICQNCKKGMGRIISDPEYLKDFGYKQIYHCSNCGSLAFNYSENSEPYYWIIPESSKNYIEEN